MDGSKSSNAPASLKNIVLGLGKIIFGSAAIIFGVFHFLCSALILEPYSGFASYGARQVREGAKQIADGFKGLTCRCKKLLFSRDHHPLSQ